MSSSAAGQLFEFRVWAELISQSRGALHVFLPLLDRGLDAVVHRLPDGGFAGIQCKSRAALRDSMLNFVVPVGSLVDDSAWLIAGLNGPEGIGPTVLAVPVGEFRKLAAVEHSAGIDWYEASFSMHPRASRWQRWLLPRESLASVLLGEATVGGSWPVDGGEVVDQLVPFERETAWLGFVGEAEVVRRLAGEPRLDLFRPFPDLETVEVLCRDNGGGGWCGLQVKTGGLAAGAAPHRVHVDVRRSSFAPSATTLIVVLAWLADAARFHEQCLVVPSAELDQVAAVDGRVWEIVFDPDAPYRSKLDRYRVALADLPRLVVERCGRR